METLETWQILALVGIGIVVVAAIAALAILVVIPRFRRRVAAPRADSAMAELEAAAARFGGVSAVDLELPEPEVVITADWARSVNLTAQIVADRQREDIAERSKRRVALRALDKIERGRQKYLDGQDQAREEGHEINDRARRLRLDPLEITSDEEREAALRRLRRANEEAENI